jgi:hypothetical protein
LGSNTTSANETVFGNNGLLFEGSSPNSFETYVTTTNPSADRTLTLPDAGGTVLAEGQVKDTALLGNASLVAPAVPAIYKLQLIDGADVSWPLDRDIRVADAWSISTSADVGAWTLEDNGNTAITNAVAAPGVTDTISRASTIAQTSSIVTAAEDLVVDGSNAQIDTIVYVLAFPR